MAKIVPSTLPIDLSQDPLRNLRGTISSLTSTKVIIAEGQAISFTLIGTGFRDSDQDGIVDRGTVQSIILKQGDTRLFSITEINRSISDIFNKSGALGYQGYIFQGADVIQGSSYADTLDGYGGNDVIRGGNGDDTWLGGSGNVVVHGNAGNDTLTGNPASGNAQQLFGDAGNDTLSQYLYDAPAATTLLLDGGNGNDTINLRESGGAKLTVNVFGGAGDDLIVVQADNLEKNVAKLKINGGDGFDTFRTYTLNPDYFAAGVFKGIEVLSTNFFDNLPLSVTFLNQFERLDAFSPQGNINIKLADAGAVDFTASVTTQLVITASNDGNTIFGSAMDDFIYGGVGDDSLHGGKGNDYLTASLSPDGQTGADQLFGDSGNDTIETAGAQEFLADGGSGIDLLNFNLDFVTDDIVLHLADARTATGITLDSGATIRNIDALNVVLGKGNDTVFDGSGDDTLNGWYGSDTIHVSDGRDTAYAGPINVQSSADADPGTVDILYVDYSRAAAGLNMEYFLQTTYVTGIYVFEGTDKSTATRLVNGVDFEKIVITGGAFADTLIASDADDTLRGGGGDDVFVAQYGSDQIFGGDGNDTLRLEFGFLSSGAGGFSASGGPALKSGATIDLTLTSAQALPLVLDEDDPRGGLKPIGMVRLDSIENVSGTYLADKLTGTATANILKGAGGDDLLFGAAGDDTLMGGDGSDTLNGGAGADSIAGGAGVADLADYAGAASGVTVSLAIAAAQNTVGAGIDTLTSIEGLAGSSFSDRLTGNGLANVISGAGGNDILTGGAGRDTLTGGLGNDTFRFAGSDFAGLTIAAADRIMDFATGDLIDLRSVDAIKGGADNAFTFIGAQAFHKTAGELRFETSAAGTLVQGDTDGDGNANFAIALDSSVTLTASDFIL